MSVSAIQKEFYAKANKSYANHALRFFKTGPGEYGEGDKFLGIRNPVIREFSKRFIDSPLKDVEKHIQSKWHEERLMGLIILANKYKKSHKQNDAKECERIFKLYIKNFKFINNWDLVDCTTPHVMGHHLIDKDRKLLYTWSKSKNLWKRRMSILTTAWFIRQGDFKDTLKLADILLQDDHDLMHKAVGWMLREVGKKDRSVLDKFLKPRYQKMPRTMLRYSIERYPESIRQEILKGKW
jgi:3-methyladenine DNA glycosylase AlkD